MASNIGYLPFKIVSSHCQKEQMATLSAYPPTVGGCTLASGPPNPMIEAPGTRPHVKPSATINHPAQRRYLCCRWGRHRTVRRRWNRAWRLWRSQRLCLESAHWPAPDLGIRFQRSESWNNASKPPTIVALIHGIIVLISHHCSDWTNGNTTRALSWLI